MTNKSAGYRFHRYIRQVGSIFTSSGTQHGGQESIVLSFHITLLHHGVIIVGLPYAFAGQTRTNEITGGSPYGASTIAGGDTKRLSSVTELEGVHFKGRHVATVTAKPVRQVRHLCCTLYSMKRKENLYVK